MTNHDLDKVTEQANRLFLDRAIEHFFSPRVATRYQLQRMADDSFVLAIGSVGTIKVDDEPARPIADVAEVFSVNRHFLIELSATINALVGSTDI